MVKLTKIYTRSGDSGTTGLGTGKRVPKAHPRVEAYGGVDETNAAVGVCVALARDTDPAVGKTLEQLQHDLFDLGADLCVPDDPDSGAKATEALRIVDAQVERLEQEIDSLNAELSPLTSFILPGGTAASAELHLARTVVRRAEREMTALAETEAVSPAAIRYVNRLSDHLFVLARWLNDKGRGDVLWTPGAHR